MTGRRCLLLIAALALTCGCAQAKSQALTDSNAFRTAYGMSFRLDTCGDADLAALYRQALVEKFDHCPFTAAAKKAFLAWTAHTEATYRAQTQQYLASQSKIPAQFDGMRQTCRDQQTSADLTRMHDLLERYARKEIGVDRVVPGACETGPEVP